MRALQLVEQGEVDGYAVTPCTATSSSKICCFRAAKPDIVSLSGRSADRSGMAAGGQEGEYAVFAATAVDVGGVVGLDSNGSTSRLAARIGSTWSKRACQAAACRPTVSVTTPSMSKMTAAHAGFAA